MDRLFVFYVIFWATLPGLVKAEDKQETLKATVVEPYADRTMQPETKNSFGGKTVEAELSGDAGGRTVCVKGKNHRVVQLINGVRGSSPCEVHYKKESEQASHDQLIWSTTSKFEACAEKAKEFVGKLSGWGWKCTSGKD